jgi:hypothetical protein
MLPKDGTPVVDWKTTDHGFDNVTYVLLEGLEKGQGF